MRYYSVNIFVNVQSGNIEVWGSAPKFGVPDKTAWKKPVRSCVLTRQEHKVFVNVYNLDIHMDLIKRIAHDYVTSVR